jgi:tetratricopeptide (TPR) repeat protein
LLPLSSVLAAPSTLPLQLHAEGRHLNAAIEYRRLALDDAAAEDTAGWFWAAADEYRHTGESAMAAVMLDRSDAASPRFQPEALLLRGEIALLARQWKEADFYFQTSVPKTPAEAASTDWHRYAARRSAVARLHAGDVERAREGLASGIETNALGALDRYAAKPRKKPWLGGMLGLIPGLGYAYSGEYANGARSLILNGLFMFGMATTAEDEQWGGFAVISFFELTWYSGSIYGGLDAAHRYNETRLRACSGAIMDGATFAPDPARLPLVSLQFAF